MSNKPTMHPDNYKAVYEYYGNLTHGSVIDGLYRAASSWAYNPNVLLSDENRAAIEAQFALGKGAIIASNHPSLHDALSIPGALRKTGIRGFQTTSAWAKDELFHGLSGVLSKATASLPVFRPMNYPEVNLREPTAGLIDTTAVGLRNGKSFVIMPEGTNSMAEDRDQVKKKSLKMGIAKSALLATDHHSFIVGMHIRYQADDSGKLHARRPTVAIASPIIDYEKTLSGLMEQVTDGMSDALNIALLDIRSS